MKTMLRNLARLWPTRDQRIAKLRQRLREAQQLGVRLKFGNQELARTRVALTRDLAVAEATIERLKQTQDRLHIRLLDERDAALARADQLQQRVTHLEQAAVAHAGIVELARQWRSYYHAPDPDPEVWARLESALGRAIDALPTAPARGFDEHWADAAGVAGPERGNS